MKWKRARKFGLLFSLSLGISLLPLYWDSGIGYLDNLELSFSHFEPQFQELENGDIITSSWRLSKMTCVKAVCESHLWVSITGRWTAHRGLPSSGKALPCTFLWSILHFLSLFPFWDLPTLYLVSSELSFLLNRIIAINSLIDINGLKISPNPQLLDLRDSSPKVSYQ